MRQIGAEELAFILRYELGRVPRGALRDMLSGHQETHRRGVSRAVERLEARMAKWEIIVPDPAENIFADRSPEELARAARKPES